MNSARVWLALLCLALLGAVRLNTGDPATRPEGSWRVVTDPNYRFTISIPDSWSAAEDSPPGYQQFSGPKSDDHERAPSIIVVAYPLVHLPGVRTLDDYHEHELRIVNRLNPTRLETRDATIDTIPAKRISFFTDARGFREFVLTVGGIRNETVYGMAFTGSPEQADRLSGEIDAIFVSFRLPRPR